MNSPTHRSMSHEGKEILRRIVEGLEGVNEGPYQARQEFANRWRIEIPRDGHIPVSIALVCTNILEVGCSNENTASNAAHLSRCHPDAIRSIAAYVETLEEDRDRLEIERDRAEQEGNWLNNALSAALASYAAPQPAVAGTPEAFDALDIADRLIERAYGVDKPDEWNEVYKDVAVARAAAPAGDAMWEVLSQVHLIKHLADNITERNFADKRLYILQTVERLRAALESRP